MDPVAAGPYNDAMATLALNTGTRAEGHVAAARVTWPLKMLVLAVTLVTVGGQLDVSWHRSIGRDSFWTPPHMMVYLCGLLAAIACGYMLVVSTLDARYRADSIGLLGMRAPTGVWLAIWGGLVMLASAPFDNWWHNAYGLDVQVASPPHIVLLAGTWAVCQGTLLLTAAAMNRARLAGVQDVQSRRLFLLVGALAVIHLMSYSMTYTFDTRLHAAKPYFLMSTGVPFALAALAATLRRRWTATMLVAIYTGFMLALVWLLPLIPATPRLGPVFQPVTHMVPPKFPILLLPAAIVLDLIWQRLRLATAPWLNAVLSAVAWVTVLVAVEWPFATFLMSAHADNRFFATRMPDFGTPPGNADVLRVFEQTQHGRGLILGLAAATTAAFVAVRVGTIFGNWMREVRR